MKEKFGEFLHLIKKNKRAFIVSLILIFLFFWLLLYVFTQVIAKRHVVTGFEECAEHGFPVMETSPRQCRDNLGNIYEEEID